MDQIMLTLKPGVMLTEQAGQTGLTLLGCVRFARDARQAQILRALALQSQSLEDLMALLHTRDGPPRNDHRISLDLAGFILDFGEYLET